MCNFLEYEKSFRRRKLDSRSRAQKLRVLTRTRQTKHSCSPLNTRSMLSELEFAGRAARIASRRRKSGDTAMQKADGCRCFGACAAKRITWYPTATFFFGIRARKNKSPGFSEQSSRSR